MSKPVISVIEHESDVNLGFIKRIVPEDQLELICAWKDPNSVSRFAQDVISGKREISRLLVLGGRANAYADDQWSWLADTKALLSYAHERNIPTLGICLGAQLMAVASGVQVDVSAAAGAECGVTPIRWCKEASEHPIWQFVEPKVSSSGETKLKQSESGEQSDPKSIDTAVLSKYVTQVFEDHSDAVNVGGSVRNVESGVGNVEGSGNALPEDFRVLAYSAKYPQVFTWGSLLGVQFHPEITEAIAREWQEHNEQTDTEEIMAGYAAAREELHATCSGLINLLISGKTVQ